MVAHYWGAGECPTGWARATDVEGRIIVGAESADRNGETVGVALGDAEDRTHTHAYSMPVDLPAKNISGSNGSNNQGAAAGGQTISGTTAAASSGLPFIQLLPCVRP